MDFAARKLAALHALSSPAPDKSRKGGVDELIVPLITRINSHPSFFTTSSCSGRISISISNDNVQVLEPKDCNLGHAIEERPVEAGSQPTRKKSKGIDWNFVSHSVADADEVIRSVLHACKSSAQGNDRRFNLMIFRFEPFILAVECVDMDAAQRLVSCAIQSGFRESGITSARKRIIVAVRCSIRIESPIAKESKLLVSEDYLTFLVQFGNEKMSKNTQRIERFFSAFVNQLESLGCENATRSTCQVKQRQISDLGSQLNPNQNMQINARKMERRLLDLERRQGGILLRLDKVEARFSGADVGCEAINGSFFTANLESIKEQKDKRFKIAGQMTMSTKEAFAVRDFSCVPTEFHKQMLCSLLEIGSLKHIPLQSSNASELLYRWGHSACQLPSSSVTSILIFGGYGGSFKQGRQNDLVLLNVEDGKVQAICGSNPPVARVGHTASLVGRRMVVIGGREGPSKPLGDVCVLEVDKMQWTYPKMEGNCFSPRHRHAAETFGKKIYIFGGLNNDKVLGDLIMLNTSKMKWKQVISLECKPSPRFSHSMAIADGKLFLYGGFDGRTVYGDLWFLELINLHWQRVTLELIPRFSHSMTYAFGHLIILGGCPLTKHTNTVSTVDIKKFEWTHAAVEFPREGFLVCHTATFVGSTMAIVGGGLSCYAFGIKFSPPFSVDLAAQDCLAGTYADENLRSLSKFDQKEKPSGVKTLMVDKAHAKVCKDRLKWLGWLDSQRKARTSEDGAHVFFPLAEKNSRHFGDEDLEEILDVSRAKCSICKFDCCISLHIVKLESKLQLKPTNDPRSFLVRAFSSFLQKHAMPVSLLREIPKRLFDSSVH